MNVLGVSASPTAITASFALGVVLGYLVYIALLRWFAGKLEELEKEMSAPRYSPGVIITRDTLEKEPFLAGSNRGLIVESEFSEAEEAGLEGEGGSSSEYLDGYDKLEDSLFKVWALVKTIVDRTLGPNYNVVLTVVDGGVPIAVYPEDVIAFIDDDHINDYGVIVEDGSVYFNLSLTTYKALVEIVEDGENAKIKTIMQARLLYSLVKELSKAASMEDKIAAYISYKTIISMIQGEVLRMEKNILDRMPFESEDLKRKIREQLRMEEEFVSKKR
ncbi:MAG: hypothetical protein F7B20_05880 [Aeropyrum sp.]|nr:hypothetical protein [Aeropyrum sp.]MCE4616284.1 hypothetical protein [Aeropyrum sp.]